MWSLGLIATVTAATVAALIGAAATTFGLGGLALAAVALTTAAGVTIWRRAMLPLAVISVCGAGATAWAAQSPERLDRSAGTLRIAASDPGGATRMQARRGVGDVLVDLRRFEAPAGSVTRIAARADAGHLVVALPPEKCVNLQVRYRALDLSGAPRLVSQLVTSADRRQSANDISFSGLGLTTRASLADSQRADRTFGGNYDDPPLTTPYQLLAFNRWPSAAGHYTRAAQGQPSAPTIALDLASSQQIVVRDYPLAIDPLAVSPDDATGGMVWPEGKQPPLRPRQSAAVRSPENRAQWIAWERRITRWVQAQARRAAGPCSTPADLQARGLQFLTQPEAVRVGGRVRRLLGRGQYTRSRIPQRVAADADAMLVVEANGLGETRLLGVRLPAAREERQ